MLRAPVFTMRMILIFLLGVVLLAPLFELFDQSQDMEQGTDLVLALLSAFMAMGLFIICRRIVYFLIRSVLVVSWADAPILFQSRSIQVEVSPPESIFLLGSLRI